VIRNHSRKTPPTGGGEPEPGTNRDSRVTAWCRLSILNRPHKGFRGRAMITSDQCPGTRPGATRNGSRGAGQARPDQQPIGTPDSGEVNWHWLVRCEQQPKCRPKRDGQQPNTRAFIARIVGLSSGQLVVPVYQIPFRRAVFNRTIITIKARPTTVPAAQKVGRAASRLGNFSAVVAVCGVGAAAASGQMARAFKLAPLAPTTETLPARSSRSEPPTPKA